MTHSVRLCLTDVASLTPGTPALLHGLGPDRPARNAGDVTARTG